MTLSEISTRIRPANEIHKSDTLCEMIQRSLSKRSHDIAKYLTSQGQHLFNSIIVGVYEGDPQWYEVNATKSHAGDGAEIPTAVIESIGLLHLTGSERIFALDGQHRVAGIEEALKATATLGAEQQSVIFVAHRNDKSGMERSRRLFATLNRYAKPVSQLEIIALDEDDPVAIATRSFLRDHELLSKKGVVGIPKGKNISTSDQEAFTTAVALYEGIQSYMTDVRRLNKAGIKEFLAKRPTDVQLETIVAQSREVIDAMIAAFPVFTNYKKNAGTKACAEPFRSKNGGHLLFRPVGFLAFMFAMGKAVSFGMKAQVVATKIAQSKSDDIGAFPWNGVIFDSASGTMKASSGKGAIEAYGTLLLLRAGLGVVASATHRKNCKSVLTKALVNDGASLSSSYLKILSS